MSQATQPSPFPSPLMGFVERIERLQAEARATLEVVPEVYTEARAAGFDVAVMRALIKERAQDPNLVSEFAALLDLYREEARRARS